MKVFILTLIFFVAAQAEIENSVHSLYLNKPNGRIIGGEEVVPHSLPYQAAIVYANNETDSICGGSLIAENVVLTAARCVDKIENFTVVLGAHNILESEDTQVRIETADVIVHPEWDSVEQLNDLALVILPEDVELNENIQLVKLPSVEDADNEYVGELGLASGWGKNGDHPNPNTFSPVLKKIEMVVYENSMCELYYPLTSTHLCTISSSKNNTCLGDEGGPFVVDEVQIGVYSFGYSGRCQYGWPPVFTRLTKFIEWILENLKNVTFN